MTKFNINYIFDYENFLQHSMNKNSFRMMFTNCVAYFLARTILTYTDYYYIFQNYKYFCTNNNNKLCLKGIAIDIDDNLYILRIDQSFEGGIYVYLKYIIEIFKHQISFFQEARSDHASFVSSGKSLLPLCSFCIKMAFKEPFHRRY